MLDNMHVLSSTLGAHPGQVLLLPTRDLVVPTVLGWAGLYQAYFLFGAYSSSGEGVVFDPQQVLGPYIRPTVGAYGPTRHFRDGYMCSLFDPERDLIEK